MTDQAPATRPNVLIVVMDDMGFSDFGCYGSTIATPAFDRLADRGVRYDTFHVTPLCSPTRAALLTGRNHHAVGMGSVLDLPGDPDGYTGRIPDSAGTLARMLRDSGYGTFAAGKWHLALMSESGPAGPFDRWPLAMGFDRYYGFLQALTNNYFPQLVRDNTFVEVPAAPDAGYHLTADLADQSIRWIQDQRQSDPDKPFFLYFAPGAMHDPHHAPREWIDAYAGRFDHGWDDERLRRHAAQLELGVIPPGTQLTERPDGVPAWDSLTPDEQRLHAKHMEVYAGFLSHTDAQVGRILDHLDETGRLDDTIVVVISDNGAAAAGPQFSYFEPLDLEERLERIDGLGGPESTPSYGPGWAWASNTPFRLWKTHTWLGGIRVPLIFSWPSGLGADAGGGIRHKFAHVIDLAPTILEAAGVVPPSTIDGVAQQPIDGRSLLETLRDPDAEHPRDTQYWEMVGSRSIYHDGWKATTDHRPMAGTGDFDRDHWTLVDLRADFSEARDRSAEEPDRTRSMVALWEREAEANGALPITDDFWYSPNGSLMRDTSMSPLHARYPDRTRFEVLPGGVPVETPAPFVLDVGFSFAADLVPDDEGRFDGVVAAHHSRFGSAYSPYPGWACRIVDGRVSVLTHPSAGGVLFASEPLPARPVRIAVGFAPADGDDPRRSITIAVDAVAVAAADVPVLAHRVHSRLTLCAELFVGRGMGLGFGDYRPGDVFSGAIRAAVLDVGSTAPA